MTIATATARLIAAWRAYDEAAARFLAEDWARADPEVSLPVISEIMARDAALGDAIAATQAAVADADAAQRALFARVLPVVEHLRARADERQGRVARAVERRRLLHARFDDLRAAVAGAGAAAARAEAADRADEAAGLVDELEALGAAGAPIAEEAALVEQLRDGFLAIARA